MKKIFYLISLIGCFFFLSLKTNAYICKYPINNVTIRGVHYNGVSYSFNGNDISDIKFNQGVFQLNTPVNNTPSTITVNPNATSDFFGAVSELNSNTLSNNLISNAEIYNSGSMSDDAYTNYLNSCPPLYAIIRKESNSSYKLLNLSTEQNLNALTSNVVPTISNDTCSEDIVCTYTNGTISVTVQTSPSPSGEGRLIDYVLSDNILSQYDRSNDDIRHSDFECDGNYTRFKCVDHIYYSETSRSNSTNSQQYNSFMSYQPSNMQGMLTLDLEGRQNYEDVNSIDDLYYFRIDNGIGGDTDYGVNFSDPDLDDNQDCARNPNSSYCQNHNSDDGTSFEFCTQQGVLKTLNIIRICIIIAKICAALILIILGSIDFGRVAVSGDEKNMKDTINSFVRRLIIAAVIFFIPSLVNTIINLATSDDSSFSDCKECFTNEHGTCDYLIENAHK
jgi:hypothetical protein